MCWTSWPQGSRNNQFGKQQTARDQVARATDKKQSKVEDIKAT